MTMNGRPRRWLLRGSEFLSIGCRWPVYFDYFDGRGMWLGWTCGCFMGQRLLAQILYERVQAEVRCAQLSHTRPRQRSRTFHRKYSLRPPAALWRRAFGPRWQCECLFEGCVWNWQWPCCGSCNGRPRSLRGAQGGGGCKRSQFAVPGASTHHGRHERDDDDRHKPHAQSGDEVREALRNSKGSCACGEGANAQVQGSDACHNVHVRVGWTQPAFPRFVGPEDKD